MIKLDIPFEEGQGLGIAIGSMGQQVSYQKVYRQVIRDNGVLRGVTFPILYAIITVDKGVVTVCDFIFERQRKC